MEEWKDVAGYEGRYQVSNLGRVRSLDKFDAWGRLRKGRVLSPFRDTGGYRQVCLRNGRGQCNKNVHRLVASAFIANPLDLPVINHKDENKGNNRADNLEWCSAEYNATYGTMQRRAHIALCRPVVQMKNGRQVGIYESTLDADRRTGVNHGSISRCCNGGQKTSGGYSWAWLDEKEAEALKNKLLVEVGVACAR